MSWHGPIDTGFVMGLSGAVVVGMIIAEVRRRVRDQRRWWPWRDLLAAQTERADPAGGSDDISSGSRPLIEPRAEGRVGGRGAP